MSKAFASKVPAETKFDFADTSFQYAPGGAILRRESIQNLLELFEDSRISRYAIFQTPRALCPVLTERLR